MKLAANILTLPLTMLGTNTINPVVFWDKQEGATLIDTGMTGGLNELKEALEALQLKLVDIKRIILTHQDIDHVGNLPALLKEAPHIEVWAHADDVPYIIGEKPLLKVGLLERVPQDFRREIEATMKDLKNIHIARTLSDGEILDLYGGITVIHTPGHTPGHISLYVPKEKLLIAGDAMIVAEGELHGPRPEVTPNMEQATASLKKFTTLDINTVLCYHGGLYTKQLKQTLATLV